MWDGQIESGAISFTYLAINLSGVRIVYLQQCPSEVAYIPFLAYEE